MATYYSNIFQGPPIRNSSVAGSGQNGFVTVVGKVLIPLSVAPATADVLKLFTKPANSTLLRMAFINNSWGTTVPIKVGDATDDDAVVAALALETARGLTTVPAIRVNDGFTADTAFTGSGMLTAFQADMPPRATAEVVQAVLGTTTAVAATTAGSEFYLTFVAELLIHSDAQSGNIVYTWNGNSSGIGTALT